MSCQAAEVSIATTSSSRTSCSSFFALTISVTDYHSARQLACCWPLRSVVDWKLLARALTTRSQRMPALPVRSTFKRLTACVRDCHWHAHAHEDIVSRHLRTNETQQIRHCQRAYTRLSCFWTAHSWFSTQQFNLSAFYVRRGWIPSSTFWLTARGRSLVASRVLRRISRTSQRTGLLESGAAIISSTSVFSPDTRN